MATLAHVLQLVGWWLAPLIIFLIKRQSRFVSFHALQALLLQITHMIVSAVFVVMWMSFIFATIAQTMSKPAQPPQPPIGLFMLFPMIWLFLMGLWVAILVIAIVYGIKASRGEWAEYPVLGRLALKILKIGPGGSVISSNSI